jgi:hypothetical protein
LIAVKPGVNAFTPYSVVAAAVINAVMPGLTGYLFATKAWTPDQVGGDNVTSQG